MSGQQDLRREMASVVPPRSAAMMIDRPPVVIDINLAWHEQVYRDAAGSLSRVPWACGRPNPALVSWLNAEAPGLIRPGSRVVVVGCGLADDVCELSDRGYDVHGFDCAPTAISWARERFPSLSTNLMSADLFNLPARLRHRFDLVVEIDTLQSIHPSLREPAVQSLASLATPHGVVLTICRGRDESDHLETVKDPPWPFTMSELSGLMESAGLRPLRAPDDFMDDEPTPVRRLRAAFVRA
jgi:hypothetical protein